MGLDIGSYKGAKLLDPQPRYDMDGEVLPEFSNIRHAVVVINGDFPGREEGLENRKAYSYEDYVSFRAGSYSGYNSWRDQLAEMAGYPKTKYMDGPSVRECYAAAVWGEETDGPFSELINFSDCEGGIGPVVSKKLMKDFQDFEDKAKDLGDYFYRVYSDFKNAFERASDNGWVDFH